MNSNIDIHEQPLLAGDVVTIRETVKCRQLEANPAKILGQCLGGMSIGVSIETGNKTRTRKEVDVAKLEK